MIILKGKTLLTKNMLILLISQLIGTTGSVLMITLAGLIGTQLSPTPYLSTLPVTLMVVGAALGTLPASQIMKHYGRKTGFCGAALLASSSLLLCAYAVHSSQFSLFCLGALCFGVNMAFVLQYRFAAAESVAKSQASQAISWVLLGSIGGAILAPEILKRTADTFNNPYLGSLVLQAVLYLMVLVLLFLLNEFQISQEDLSNDKAARPFKQLFFQNHYLIAIAAGITAQGVMTLIMTATPISMHLHNGYSMLDTSGVIRAHVIAMYLPSLFSGYLIFKLGVKNIMLAGWMLFVVTIAIGFSGQQLGHYWITLVILGVGWNFLFVGGTTLLTTTYNSNERFTAQGVNDFAVLGFSAAASLLAGSLLAIFGWHWLVLAPIPLLLITFILIIRLPNVH